MHDGRVQSDQRQIALQAELAPAPADAEVSP
jgi:hypothetical protein